MIDLSFEAKKLDIKIGELLSLMPVPARTFRDWCVTKPELAEVLLSSLHHEAEIKRLKDSLSMMETLKTSLNVAETQNEYFKQEIIKLKKSSVGDAHLQGDLLAVPSPVEDDNEFITLKLLFED